MWHVCATCVYFALKHDMSEAEKWRLLRLQMTLPILTRRPRIPYVDHRIVDRNAVFFWVSSVLLALVAANAINEIINKKSCVPILWCGHRLHCGPCATTSVGTLASVQPPVTNIKSPPHTVADDNCLAVSISGNISSSNKGTSCCLVSNLWLILKANSTNSSVVVFRDKSDEKKKNESNELDVQEAWLRELLPMAFARELRLNPEPKLEAPFADRAGPLTYLVSNVLSVGDKSSGYFL